MAQGPLTLRQIAQTCGTRFVKSLVGLSTFHPVAWKNAFWMQLALKESGYGSTYSKSGDGRFYVHVNATGEER